MNCLCILFLLQVSVQEFQLLPIQLHQNNRFGTEFKHVLSLVPLVLEEIEFNKRYVTETNKNLNSGADYMGIFNPGWNFNSLNQIEISSRLNNKLLFKMTLQLHVKISTQYTELKFQLGLAKPRWNFNPGWKFQIFHIIDIFFNPEWKFDTTRARIPCLRFKK